MIPYWVLFFIPAAITILPFRGNRNLKSVSLLFLLIITSLLIGLRYRVGGDWSTYIVMLEAVGELDFFSVLSLSDPGYYIINWISIKLGLGIFGVNLLGGFIFVSGILVFCKKQPIPWLGLSVAIPYMIIVVGMGYSRQAIALGFVLFAFAFWPKKNFVIFTLFILAASSFHKSAIVLLPLALFINKRYIKEKIFIGIPLYLALSFYFLWSFIGSAAYLAYFIDPAYDSRGVLVRVMMNIIPACIFLLYREKFKRFEDSNLWFLISIASLLCLLTSIPLSTVTDRLALFLSPIQLMVYSRLTVIFKNRVMLTIAVLSVLMLYGFSLFVWLNYAFHAYAWVPYKSVLDI